MHNRKEQVRAAFDCRAYLEQEHGAKCLGGDRYTKPWKGNANDDNPSLAVFRDGWTDFAENGVRGDCFSLVARCTGRDIKADFPRIVEDAAQFAGIAPEKTARNTSGRSVDPKENWRRILDRSQPDDGKIAAYLRDRGLSGSVPEALRYQPMLLYWEKQAREKAKPTAVYPAVVAVVSDADGTPVAIHRTYLDPAGKGKAPVKSAKKALGPAAKCAVHLGEPSGGKLVVAEGIETALSVSESTGIPAWAALGTSGLRSLELPDDVREIWIAADNDKNGAGLKAAQHAANRWAEEGRSVRIMMPSETGDDWNDVLQSVGTKPVLEAMSKAPVWETGGKSDESDGSLYEEYGPLLVTDKNGNPAGVNESHAAARYCRDTRIIFEPAFGLFYLYDGSTGLWRARTEDKTRTDAAAKIRGYVKVKSTFRFVNNTLMQNVIKWLKGMAEKQDFFVKRRNVIHVQNGMLEIADDGTVALKPFSPDYHSRNRSELAWDPAAKCPRFLGELLALALKPDDIGLIQRYAGQCLLGRNPSQTVLLLRGTAGGGKSTLADIIERVIGPHNVCSLRTRHLESRFELAAFVDCTLLAGKDVPGTFLNTDGASTIKALVGGDRLQAEAKNRNERREVIGDFCVLITTNTRLRVRLDSDENAWRRRLLIVDYERPKPEKPIPEFAGRLIREEGPGILAWAVAGAVKLIAELRDTGAIHMTDAQSKRVDDLLNESDSVRTFASECVYAKTGQNVTTMELNEAYRDFCDAKGWEPLTERLFQRQLPDAMLDLFRAPKRNDITRMGKNQRGFCNVALRPVQEHPSQEDEQAHTEHTLTDDSRTYPQGGLSTERNTPTHGSRGEAYEAYDSHETGETEETFDDEEDFA